MTSLFTEQRIVAPKAVSFKKRDDKDITIH